jgi:hypothetical protein
MQKLTFSLAFLSCLIVLANGIWAEAIQIDALPSTVEKFIELRDNLAKTPEGGAAMFVLAMIACVQDQELGTQFFTLMLEQEQLMKTDKGQVPNNAFKNWLKRLKEMPHLGHSYILGTTPDAKYVLPAAPYQLEITRNPYSVIKENEVIKVFVKCSGADSARPIRMRLENGIWKASEYSSLFTAMRAPKK